AGTRGASDRAAAGGSPVGEHPSPDRSGVQPKDDHRGPGEPAEAPAGVDAGATLGGGDSTAQGGAEEASGPELARAVLDAALAKRRAAAANPRRRSGEGTGKRPRGYSG